MSSTVLLCPPAPSQASLRDAFVALVGTQAWAGRLRDISRRAECGTRIAQLLRQRHAIELTIDRLPFGPMTPRPLPAAQRLSELIGAVVALERRLPPAGRCRLAEAIQAGLTGDGTLVPIFHLVRIAELQEQRGFSVHFAGLCEGEPFDLLLSRGGITAEVACDVVSADTGRDVQRAAWHDFADRIEPAMQSWLARHDGGYLLRITLPSGLREGAEEATGSPSPHSLHSRVRRMLERGCRRDDDAAGVLRLDPLPGALIRSGGQALLAGLRQEFGPEVHLCVTMGGDGKGAFAVAARAGRANEVGAAVCRRMASLPPTRLTGTRPGILAMLVEDIDRAEWRSLLERLEMEVEARRFLVGAAARAVVAVSCASRFELLGLARDSSPEGELRFRNASHPAARLPALAPAVLSPV